MHGVQVTRMDVYDTFWRLSISCGQLTGWLRCLARPLRSKAEGASRVVLAQEETRRFGKAAPALHPPPRTCCCLSFNKGKAKAPSQARLRPALLVPLDSMTERSKAGAASARLRWPTGRCERLPLLTPQRARGGPR